MSNQLTIEDNVISIIPTAMNLAKSHNAVQMNAEQNYAIQQLYKNDLAIKCAYQNPVSVQNAVLNVASIGISLNPALKHAYLVPRDGSICLDISYMGLMHIAQQIGSIQWGQARIVYANDTYENQGIDKEPLHKYNAFGDRGEKVGVYCAVKLPSGDFLTEEMSAEQVTQVRETSKSKNSGYSPWNTFEEEMWRKTVVKRASKYWPKSSGRLDTAIHELNKFEGIEEHQVSAPSDIDKLAEYASDKHTPLELYGFMESFREKDEEYYLNLYSRFPKGLKVSGKAKHKEGGEQFRAYIEIFNNGDESEIAEAREEMTDLELKIIDKALKPVLVTNTEAA